MRPVEHHAAGGHRVEVISHGAPPFAPWLFVDLAVLALIGLHGLGAMRGRAPLVERF